jgi:hypothetical protein
LLGGLRPYSSVIGRFGVKTIFGEIQVFGQIVLSLPVLIRGLKDGIAPGNG